jgi:hypothetical protein
VGRQRIVYYNISKKGDTFPFINTDGGPNIAEVDLFVYLFDCDREEREAREKEKTEEGLGEKEKKERSEVTLTEINLLFYKK